MATSDSGFEAALHRLALVVDPAITAGKISQASDPDVESDIRAIVDGLRLQKIRRYFHQIHWLEESRLAAKADEAEPHLKLENVAAHSWHVADVVLLLASRFTAVDAEKALKLAILHDKLEVFTGDFDPVGPDGTGRTTHAFDNVAKALKSNIETEAAGIYLQGLRSSVRSEQEALIAENILGNTASAAFVKAADKLQALAFVHEKKQGALSDAHILFSIRYSYKCVELFAGLAPHYFCLLGQFLRRVAAYRHNNATQFVEAIRANLESNSSEPNKHVRIALVGKSGAGKSEVSRRLANIHGFSVIRTGAVCREISKALFGNDDKSSTQRLDDALTPLDPSIFLRASLRDVDLNQNVVVDALRFESDVSLVKALNFITVRITCDESLRISRLATRGQAFNPLTDGFHRSETELDTYVADYEILNQQTRTNLEDEVDAVVWRVQ